MAITRREANFIGAVACGLLLAYAYYLQYVEHLEPCPLCIFQRIAVLAVGVLFLVAALHPARRIGSIVYGVLILLVAGATTWVAGRHVWIQHQPAGTVPSCGAPLDTLVEMFPLFEVIRRVMTGGGECGTVDWTLLGISMPGWVLILAVSLGLVGIVNNIVYPSRRA